MKKYINRLILAAAIIVFGAGTAKSQDVLEIDSSVKNATVEVYKADAKPMSAPSGATVTSIAPGEWIILKVTPTSDYWTYDGILTIQPAGSIGGAEVRPHRALMVPVHPTALSGNEADGTGCYYLQIPAEWNNADGYTKVVIGGEAIPKINLSSATLSDKTLTATTGDWTVNITFDALSFPYTGSVQWPAIESFSLTNGSKSYFIYGKHVSISGSGIEAGTYDATLTSEEHGCLTGTKTVDFMITQVAGYIKYNTTSVTKTYGDDAFKNSLSKFGDGTVKYIISPAGIATVDETTGEVTITGCGDATITATVTDGKNYTYATNTATYTLKVNKAATTINVHPTLPNPFEMNVNDELMAGGLAALSPSAAGELVYTSGDATILQVSDGIIKALKEGTTNIKVSFPGNANYLAATDKYIPFTVSLNTATVSVDKENVELLVGGTHAISATTSPSGLAVTYTADGSGVVSVDASGNVKALKEGTGTITVKVGGDGVYAENTKTITVTVSKISTTITVTYPNLELEVLDQVNSGAVLLPPEAGVLTYTSDKPAVAIVESSKIKALSEGTAVITVSYAGNNKYAAAESKTITVHVTKDLDENNITLDIPTGGYVYDGTPKTPTVTVKDGDKTLTKGTDYNVSYSNNVNAGTATVTITDIDGGDYNVSGTKTFSIAKKPLTVTAKPKAITYGDAPTNDGVTYSGFVSGENENADGIFGTSTLSYDYDYTQYGNVGTYDITPKGLTAANYNITFSKGTLTVGQKTVGLTWEPNPASFIYNNSAQAPTAIATGMVNSDAISVTVAVSAKSGSSLTDSKAVNVGSYTATATGLTGDKAGNYKLPTTGLTQDFSITSAASVLTLAPAAIPTLTYNGSAQNLVSAGTATNGTVQYRLEDGTYSASIPTGTTAGTYKVYYKVVGNTNYTDVPEAGPVTVTIAKADITVKAKDKTITYGDAPTNDGVTYSGFVSGEDEKTEGIFGTSTLSYDYDYTQYGNVGTYDITPKGLTAANYNITFSKGTLTVGQKTVGLTWTPNPASFTYSNSAKAPMAFATNTVNSDAISVTVAVSAKSGSSLTDGKAVNAGSYTATATGLTGDKAGNYKLPATTTQDFTISIAVNSFTAQPTITGWTYGDTPNDPSGAVANFGTPVYKYSTTADGTYSETVPQNAGTYYVKAFVTSTNDYADAESEAVSFTIKKKALTVTAEDKNITFGDAPPTYTFSYSGFVNGESADVLTTKPTATCAYTAGSNVGTYPISASGADDENYQFTYVPGTLTVGAKSITGATVTTDPTTYVYDGTAKTPNVIVVLDDKTLVKGTDYDVEYTGNIAAGNATVTVTGKGNYAGTANGTFTIQSVKVSVSVVDLGSGEEIEGATVQVLDGEGNLIDEWVSTTEPHEIDGLKAGVEYTLRETIAPQGYTIATDCTFTIDESGKVTSTGTITEDGVLLVENSKTHVEISVVNIANGDGLAGATVQVIDSQGNVVEEWVSATENHEIDGLKTGEEYTLKETVAPEGYVIPTDCKFTIDETGKITTTGSITEDGVLLVENTKIKKLGTIELSKGEFTYDGVTHKPTVTVKDLDGDDIPEEQYTISYLDSKGNPVSDPTDADTYTVVITDKTGTGYDHYIVNGTATFVINKKVLTITAKDQSVNFGTAITQSTEQVTADGLVTGHVLTGVTLTQSTTSITTSGTITPSNAVIKRVDTDVTANYDITYNKGTLIINASTAASAVVTANDREYDRSAQPLVTIGAIYNGETGTADDVVFYESATSTTPLTGIPQGTNAGTYEVFYEVKPDGDHTAPARARVTVTISPIAVVAVTITGHNNTSVYDGTEHSVTGYDVEISTPLYTEADFTFSGTATAKRTGTGMTTMGLNTDQFTNENTNFSTVTFNVTDGYQTIISPDIVIVTITGHSNTTDYDDTEHSVTGYDVEISNPLYTIADFTFSGTASATRTNAGKTMMGLNESQFTNTNTNFGTVTFNVTDGYQAISPIAAAVTITGHNNTTTYNGVEHSVTDYDVSFSNPLYKESYFTFSGTASAARTEEGTTYMGLTEEQFENTSANFDPVTFTVIDGYQTITAVTDVVVTITGHSSTLDYDGTTHTVSGYDVEISNPLYKVSDFTFSGTAEVTRKDAGTTMMGLAPTQFTNKNTTDFSNVTFNVTDGYQTINPITATVTIKGHSNMAVYDGTEHSVTGYDVTFSNDLYKQTDFTFSGSAGAAQTYKGTDYMGLSEGQFANTSPNFSKVTFTVIDGYQTITQRPLNITANEQAIEYGTDIATDLEKVTAVGLQGSDELSKITLTASLTASSKEITNDGTITPSNAKIMNGDADMTENYDITYNTGTLIIEYVMNLKAGYVTFCSPFDLMLTDGMKAYTVSNVSEERGVVLDEQNAIGKNVPMILNIETAGTYKLRKTDPQNFSSVPEFIGVTDANGTDVNTIAGDVYILKDGKFVWSREGTVPQYRCYAVINNAAGARSLSIIVDNESNGIDNLLWSDEEEGNWYSLDGQKLDGKPTAKGLYIMIPANGRSKGKKVMIK